MILAIYAAQITAGKENGATAASAADPRLLSSVPKGGIDYAFQGCFAVAGIVCQAIYAALARADIATCKGLLELIAKRCDFFDTFITLH